MFRGASYRVLLGLLFFGVRGSEEHSLQIKPSTMVVRYGDPVSVNCTASEDHEGIGWEASEGSVDMVEGVQFVTWSLYHITDWEIGPTCYGNFLDGTKIVLDKKSLRITLYKPPDSVSISAVNHEGPMLEGKQYQLQCEVQNIAPVQYLTVKWYKGVTLQNQTTRDDLTKIPVNVSSILLITPSHADDGAQYSCVAELELGPEGPQAPPEVKSDPFNISVLYKPRVSECPDIEELREGETLDTLASCRAEGNPPPMVTWYRNQSEFNSSTPLTRRDVGWYVILAKNTLGSVSVNITVGYRPIFACSQKYEVIQNERHTLRCTPEGFPVPKVTWFKEEENDEVELPPQMTRSDAGQYILMAGNIFGTANHSLDIDVLYPPSEIVELESDEVDFGAAVVLKCSSQGNPQPVYTWKYHNSSNVQKHNVDGLSLLNISNARKENNGSYNCCAQNQIGLVCKSITLTVRGEEKSLHTPRNECLKLDPSTVVVRYGDPVSVNCTVTEDHEGIGWEASEGSVDMVDDVEFVIWSLEALTDWSIGPKCFVNYLSGARDPAQCREMLNITVYKPPDSVSISAVNHTGPMMEGKEYQLQCEVQNIAPVQYLTIRWYQGERELEHQDFHENVTKTPLNVSSTLLVTPTSADDGAQYSCVAELELGPEGPQPSPEVKSDPVNITVLFPPFFHSPGNDTLEKAKGETVTLEKAEGETVILNCSAQGNPSPEYSWSSPLSQKDKTLTLNSLSPGHHTYSCNASNAHGIATRTFTVKIIAIVDYLPLIAGIVALSVVFILIAFSFIYCIYYKNNKMGQYDLKLGKCRMQNAHVAQNGRDSSLPMKKLTQPSVHV